MKNRCDPFLLGIDLGGTKIEGIILDPASEVLFRERIATEQEKGYEHILSRIAHLYEKMKKEIKGAKHTLGIGTPGAVSHKTGLLKNSNTVCLNGKPFTKDLEELLNRPFAISNDANCFAMAEALDGAGKGFESVFGVILGTGCGGGFVYKGEVLNGLQSIAGEWGHTSIDPAGPECYCGARGCVETFISGGGAENRYELKTGEKRSLEEIANSDEAVDIEFMEEYYKLFGRALANVINVLDPHVIVLGGGVSNMEGLYSEGMREVERQVFSDSLETPVVKHELGDSAGVIGAALIGT